MMQDPGIARSNLRERLNLLESVLPGVEERKHVGLYLRTSSRHALVRGQGKEIAIPGKDFAGISLFSVWSSVLVQILL